MQLPSEDVGFLVWILGCSWDIHIWVVLSVSLCDLSRSFRSSVLGRLSIRCVCSGVTFFCRVDSYATGLAGWVDSSWFSVISVSCFVCLGFVGSLVTRVEVCLTTVVMIVFASTICVVLSLVFPSFGLKALGSVVMWLLAVVTSWLGFFWIFCVASCVTVFVCSSSGTSKPFSSNFFSKSDISCFYMPFSKSAKLFDLFS